MAALESEVKEQIENVVAENVVEISAPKKSRGRPAKNPLLETEVKEGSPAAKKSGAGRPKKKLFDNESKTNLSRQIIGIHLITAKMTGIPELIIDENEAAILADSIVNIAEEYGLAMSGKMGAWAQLIGTAAFIYTPRLIAVKQRVVKEQENLNAA
jgi:predicted ArsR family transcriptional regulator